jgi:hypothetical protein
MKYMKLSSKQANLLAKEIVRQLELKNSFKMSEAEKQPIKKFFDKRAELQQVKDKAQEAINTHDRTFSTLVGNKRGYYVSDGYNKIIEQLEKKSVPAINEIEDEIILKSMFANPDDLQKFVDSIVLKYSKKLKLKAASN